MNGNFKMDGWVEIGKLTDFLIVETRKWLQAPPEWSLTFS